MSLIKDLKRTISLMLTKSVVKVTPTMDLNDVVVIVTGASKGIGKATTEVLVAAGAKVTAVARNSLELVDGLQNVSEENCLKLTADITKDSDVKNIVEKTLSKFKKIDVLINCAGMFIDDALENTSVESVDAILDTNIKAAIVMSQEVIPHMKKRNQGFIINIGSKISRNTNVSPNKTLYATTKYAIEGFSYALNKELKPFGLRVTCLMPGTVNTFFSTKSGDYLSPYRVGEVIAMLIKFNDVDFENFVIKSINQNI